MPRSGGGSSNNTSNNTSNETTPEYTYSDLSSAQSDLSAEQSRRAALVDKRDRLQAAYDSLSTYKDQVEEQKNIFNGVYNGSYQWKGEKHDSLFPSSTFDCTTLYYIYANYNDVFTRIDNVLDDINVKRLDCDNLIAVCDGNIISLNSLINSISTYLQNWTN